MWKIPSQVKTGQLAAFPELKMKILEKILMRSAPFHLPLGHFLASKLSSGWLVGNIWMSTFQPKWNFSIWYPFAPLQKCILPRLLLVCPKRGSEVIFCMFFDLLGTQTLMKCFGSGWVGVFHHGKSKNANLSWFGPPNLQGSARRATRWAQKPVFYPKFQNWQNFPQTCWNLGWGSSIKYHALSKRLRPKFGVDRVFFAVLVPCSIAL